jgi:hypothetical protein
VSVHPNPAATEGPDHSTLSEGSSLPYRSVTASVNRRGASPAISPPCQISAPVSAADAGASPLKPCRNSNPAEMTVSDSDCERGGENAGPATSHARADGSTATAGSGGGGSAPPQRIAAGPAGRVPGASAARGARIGRSVAAIAGAATDVGGAGAEVAEASDNDICGLCGQPGADKMAMWTGGGIYWPGEHIPDAELVHAECERDETRRAHAALTQQQRDAVIRGASGGVWPARGCV